MPRTLSHRRKLVSVLAGGLGLLGAAASASAQLEPLERVRSFVRFGTVVDVCDPFGDCSQPSLEGTLTIETDFLTTARILDSDLKIATLPFPGPERPALSSLQGTVLTFESGGFAGFLFRDPENELARIEIGAPGVLDGDFPAFCCDPDGFDLPHVELANVVLESLTPRPLDLVSGESLFRIEATRTVDGEPEKAAAGFALTRDSGAFWFFAPHNVEIQFKLVDGCAINGHHWFFASGTTNVAATVRIARLGTAEVRTYSSPAGTPFAPILDTEAFPCSGGS